MRSRGSGTSSTTSLPSSQFAYSPEEIQRLDARLNAVLNAPVPPPSSPTRLNSSQLHPMSSSSVNARPSSAPRTFSHSALSYFLHRTDVDDVDFNKLRAQDDPCYDQFLDDEDLSDTDPKMSEKLAYTTATSSTDSTPNSPTSYPPLDITEASQYSAYDYHPSYETPTSPEQTIPIPSSSSSSSTKSGKKHRSSHKHKKHSGKSSSSSRKATPPPRISTKTLLKYRQPPAPPAPSTPPSPLSESLQRALSLNDRYQTIAKFFFECRTSGILDSMLKSYQSANSDLIDLKLDFLTSIKTYGRLIISERYLTFEEKTIKPKDLGGAAGGVKYLVNNILFKFAVDNGLYGSDYAAMKVAGHELKGLQHYLSCDIPELCFPMIGLVDFLGFRLIAITLLPLGKNSMLYGTADAGKTIHDNPKLCGMMATAAQKLNLAPHICGSSGTLLSSAADIEGHIGTDNRYYLLDFSRSMPPTTPDQSIPQSHLFRLFRSEAVRNFPRPLCSDAYSGFISKDPARATYNSDIREATTWLLETHLPKVSPKIAQSICEILSLKKFASINISYQFHQFGLNMRYLGLVFANIYEKYPVAAHYLLLEIVARIVKNMLRRRLRKKMAQLKIPLEAPYGRVIIQYLNQVFTVADDTTSFSKNSPESTWLGIMIWAQRHFFLDPELVVQLAPIVKTDENFVPPPFHHHRQILGYQFPSDVDDAPLPGRYILLYRILELTGIKLAAPAVSRLRKSDFRSQYIPFEFMDFEKHGFKIKYLPQLSTCQGLRSLTDSRIGIIEGEPAVLALREALKRYKVALGAAPSDPNLLLECAMTKAHLLDLKDTELTQSDPEVVLVDQFFQMAISRWTHLSTPERPNPALSEACFHYARFLARAHRLHRADDYFIRSLEVDPNSVRTLEEYISFLQSCSDARSLSTVAKLQARLQELRAARYSRHIPSYKHMKIVTYE